MKKDRKILIIRRDAGFSGSVGIEDSVGIFMGFFSAGIGWVSALKPSSHSSSCK